MLEAVLVQKARSQGLSTPAQACVQAGTPDLPLSLYTQLGRPTCQKSVRVELFSLQDRTLKMGQVGASLKKASGHKMKHDVYKTFRGAQIMVE